MTKLGVEIYQEMQRNTWVMPPPPKKRNIARYENLPERQSGANIIRSEAVFHKKRPPQKIGTSSYSGTNPDEMEARRNAVLSVIQNSDKLSPKQIFERVKHLDGITNAKVRNVISSLVHRGEIRRVKTGKCSSYWEVI